MKSIKITSIALAFSLAVVFSAFAAQEQNTPAPRRNRRGSDRVDREVTAIDYQTKMVTLKGPEGKVVTLHAKNAQNLDQVKAGDIVKVKFIDSLAIFVRKADSPPDVGEGEAVALAPKGAMPGGIMAQTAQITANVQAIDYQKRTGYLKGLEGRMRTIKVGDVVKNWSRSRSETRWS